MKHVLGTSLAIAALCVSSAAWAQDATAPAGQLERAVSDYAAAQEETDRDARLAGFARAERGFASLVASGIESVPLYTNQGNAAWQAGDPGRAVVAYRRALRIDPDAATAAQNLAFVRASLPGWVPRPQAQDGMRAALDPRRVPLSLRRSAAAVAFLLMAVCFAISVRREEGAWRSAAVFAGVVWSLVVGSSFVVANGVDERAVVVTAPDAWALSSDSARAPRALPRPLPPGAEATLLERRTDWSRVRLANGRDVWLRASQVTAIERPTIDSGG